ncbi:hypothetical protein D9758_005205 [Tetrapyrgos nigripes]|uniref:Integrase catalytic domain-containing protein n=1 Tax=Tetrapyrgos nigripes TaxID=182062 RepID=A0A8H5GX65_9AGAR|nr:hypothetical protein D9758_005205 [Tetrapyrgos nigripes]
MYGTVESPSTEVITKANYQWYLDVWGLAQVTSIGRNLYILVGVDAGTAKKLVELMKNHTAETIIKILDALKTKAEVQTEKKLKWVRTDNAPEWRSALMREWSTKHGIKHEFTAPYTSPSNGVAEHGIGVLLEGTRAALFNSGLPPAWWGHAMMSVAYVQNLFPNSSGHIPEELWTGQCQNISHLGFVNIPEKSGKKKLDTRGFKAQMVGYMG